MKPSHEEFPTEHEDKLLSFLHHVIKFSTKLLAILMALVILWGVVDVIHIVYNDLAREPIFQIRDIVKTFGAFLAVLIAYEIFTNITIYLRTDVFPVQLVIATALMAISRKVIILEPEKFDPMLSIGIGAIILGLGITYWLIRENNGRGVPTPTDLARKADSTETAHPDQGR
jgi:uncharacterized membrane protein (DUF373 family)